MGNYHSKQSTGIPHRADRMPFTPSGAVTGIVSLLVTSVAFAIQLIAEFSKEIPFWPQLPRLSARETVIGQGLGAVADLIEPRHEGYGYQVKEGQIDFLLEKLQQRMNERPRKCCQRYAASDRVRTTLVPPLETAIPARVQNFATRDGPR